MKMIRSCWFLVVCAFAWAPSLLTAQGGLESSLREAAHKVRGSVGIYARHIRTGETVALNADTLFPTATMVKVPILCGGACASVRPGPGAARAEAKQNGSPMTAKKNGDARVVVTGLGMVSPLGLDLEASWRALCAGTSGADIITCFDPSAFSTRMAAEVRGFVPENHMDRKDVKRNDRFVHFAIAAAKEAVQNAGLSAMTEENEIL